MSQSDHPEELTLLRHADRELNAGEAGAVAAHLAGCQECRTRLDEIRGAFASLDRYRQVALPRPPRPWDDIHRGFNEIDSRLSHPVRTWFAAPRRWVPAVALVVLAVVGYYRIAEVPSARAAELLRRAAATESAKTSPKRIRIRTRSQELTRSIGRQDAAASDAALAALFRSANYDWEDPLSARAFQRWRDALPEKKDEVIVAGDRYRIRTTTGSSELVEASLQLRVPDLHAFEASFAFRNRETVEIGELPAEAPLRTSTGGPEAAIRSPSTVEPERKATPGEEIAVFAALHQLGADLGEPIEVSRSGGEVLVTGIGVDPQRVKEIQNALGALPHVSVRVSEPAAGSALDDPARVEPVSPRPSPLQALIEKHLGGRSPFDQFADAVLGESEAMMARAHALRRLSRRFDVDAEMQLAGSDRQILAGLVRDLTETLVRREMEIQRLMDPVMRSLSAAAPSGGPTPDADRAPWQTAVAELFDRAGRVDRAISVVFGGAAAETEPQARQLAEDLARLRVACRKAQDTLR